MKSIILIVTFILGMTSLFAQETAVPQPDFANVPAYYIEGSSQLLNFSKETLGMVGKIGKAVYELKGADSQTRIQSSDKYVFVIKGGEIDPSTITSLYKMEQKKKTRQAIMATTGFTSASLETKHLLKYSLVKLADKVYKIVPEEKLTPGEYMFMVGATPYSFGIN